MMTVFLTMVAKYAILAGMVGFIAYKVINKRGK